LLSPLDPGSRSPSLAWRDDSCGRGAVIPTKLSSRQARAEAMNGM
jgi:hypothetical protein